MFEFKFACDIEDNLSCHSKPSKMWSKEERPKIKNWDKIRAYTVNRQQGSLLCKFYNSTATQETR
jgi:hypothetical protein